MLQVTAKASACQAAVPSRPPRKAVTPYSALMASRSSVGRAATAASWAAVGVARTGLQPGPVRHAVAVVERGQGEHEPDRRAGEHRGQARMGVVLERPRDQLDRDTAPGAGGQDRSAQRIDPTTLDQRAIGQAQVRALVEQRVEVLAARLLLALDEEADPAGQGTDRRQVGLDAPDAREHLALVVGRATGIEPAIAHGRLIGGRRPQVMRRGRLDVVVLDHVDRPRTAADLAHDERRHVRAAGQLDELDRGAEAAQPRRAPLGRLCAAQRCRWPPMGCGRSRPAPRSSGAGAASMVGRSASYRSVIGSSDGGRWVEAVGGAARRVSCACAAGRGRAAR